MHVGASMFFTDYAIAAQEIGPALEQRGFEFDLGARALAYPAVASLAMAGRRRSFQNATTTRWTRSLH